MANFFSLGSGSGRSETTTTQQPGNNNPNLAGSSGQPGVVVYRNEEIYQKGFEIWQQYVQVHHHHPPPPPFLHHHHLHHGLYLGGGGGGDPYQPSSSSVGLAGPTDSGVRTTSSGSRAMMMMKGVVGVGGSSINCQDCGNQAKKDCSHMRCRTCCKSRGFDCSTHVKSTWVPASKRRERHQQHLLALQQPPPNQLETGIIIREKRQRASPSGLEVGQHFPSELSSPAVFRCVKVHSVDDTNEQLAYQTAVNIGGHVFKGILYDQGPDQAHYTPVTGDSSSSVAANLLPNNPDDPGVSGSGTGPLVDPNAIYPPAIMSAFLAGTQFFPPPRS